MMSAAAMAKALRTVARGRAGLWDITRGSYRTYVLPNPIKARQVQRKLSPTITSLAVNFGPLLTGRGEAGRVATLFGRRPGMQGTS